MGHTRMEDGSIGISYRAMAQNGEFTQGNLRIDVNLLRDTIEVQGPMPHHRNTRMVRQYGNQGQVLDKESCPDPPSIVE
jgi:hypothetical protein